MAPRTRREYIRAPAVTAQFRDRVVWFQTLKTSNALAVVQRSDGEIGLTRARFARVFCRVNSDIHLASGPVHVAKRISEIKTIRTFSIRRVRFLVFAVQARWFSTLWSDLFSALFFD